MINVLSINKAARNLLICVFCYTNTLPTRLVVPISTENCTSLVRCALITLPSKFRYQCFWAPRHRLLFISDLDTFSQTLNLELLASGTAVDVLDIISGCLEVAGGIVALRDEKVVLGSILERLVNGNRSALVSRLRQR